MDGYNIISKVLNLQEISAQYVTKRSLAAIANNLKHDKVALALISTMLPGTATTSLIRHVLVEPKSQRAILLLAKKYKVSPKTIEKLLIRNRTVIDKIKRSRVAAEKSKKLAKYLSIGGTVTKYRG